MTGSATNEDAVVHALDHAALECCPFQIAFRTSPLPMAIASVDGRILEANARYAEMLGRSPSEIIGRPFADFTHPDDVSRSLAERDRTLREEGAQVQFEKRYVRPDGSIVWARLTSTLQRDHDGRPIQFITHIQDLSEARRTEAALQQRDAQYRTLVEHAPEAILVLDVDHDRFIDANPNAERLFRMTREELLKIDPWDLRAPHQPTGPPQPPRKDRIRAALAGKVETYERVLRDSTGREFYCELRLVRLPSDEKRLIRASIIEITDRKLAEERQQRLIRELNHRVKNTLSSILTLARQSVIRARTLEEFDRGFTGRLTALSRAHEALTSAQWEQIELDALIRLILGPHMMEHRPKLTFTGERILLPARAVVPLGMALHELGTNALKHGALSGEGGRVEINWRSSGRSLELTWREHGSPRSPGPMREGTGVELIRGFIAYELGGEVHFDPRPDSFTATFRVPLER